MASINTTVTILLELFDFLTSLARDIETVNVSTPIANKKTAPIFTEEINNIVIRNKNNIFKIVFDILLRIIFI